MPNEEYRARRAGSVRFDPYYKLELWDERRLCWRPLQRRFWTEELARQAIPADARARLLRITETGRALVGEPPIASDGFETWCRAVDAALFARCALERDDLPDYAYRDAFDAGESPQQVALAVLSAAGLDGLESD